jgi:hypothetical protein
MALKVKYLNFTRALDLVRDGGVLQQMHTKEGRQWFVLHKRGGAVKAAVAEQIKSCPDICPQNDGLLKDCSQTWSSIHTH